MTDNKRPVGRPPSLLPDARTLATVRGLGRIQATTRECAAVLGVSHPTFLKFTQEYPEVADLLEQGKQRGLQSLRRQQFKAAENGNSTMLVWLGKQYLGQTDKTAHEHTGANGGPIQTVDLTNATDDDLARLEALLGPIASAAGGAAEADQGGEGEEGAGG